MSINYTEPYLDKALGKAFSHFLAIAGAVGTGEVSKRPAEAHLALPWMSPGNCNLKTKPGRQSNNCLTW